MSGLALAASPALAWVAAAVAVVAFGGALAIEWHRDRAPATRGLRTAMLALACAAAFLLVTGPQRWRARAPRTVVLLTTGATTRDLAAALARGVEVWSLAGAPGEPAPPPAPRLPDLAALGRRAEVTRVELRGHGLAPWERALLDLPVDAAPPPPLPFGIAAASWPRRLPLGAELVVRITAAGVPVSGATLRLVGDAIEPTSARVTAAAPSATLRALPRGAGRHLLGLRVEAAAQRPRQEPLDVEVTSETPPAVLWLEGAPGAESRALARWLEAAGGRVAVRATISRGITRQAFTGMPAAPLAPLSSSTLASFDVVVIDARTLAALAPGERDALGGAVRGGLGLLLRAGDARDASEVSLLGVRFATTSSTSAGAERSVRLRGDDGPSAPTPPLTLPARVLAPAVDLVPLARDDAGYLLAAWRPLGTGRVGVSLVEGTYRWALEGHVDVHRDFWRRAFAALARPAVRASAWALPAGPLLVDLPLSLRLRALSPQPAASAGEASGAVVPLALRQDDDDPRAWSTTYWPRGSGWVRLATADATASAWVAPAGAWSTWRLAERQRASSRVGRVPSTSRDARRSAPARELVPLPRWPFFVVLVAALALLWADEALRPAGERRTDS